MKHRPSNEDLLSWALAPVIISVVLVCGPCGLTITYVVGRLFGTGARDVLNIVALLLPAAVILCATISASISTKDLWVMMFGLLAAAGWLVLQGGTLWFVDQWPF